MMLRISLFIMVFSSSFSFALPPPQGKSIRSDGNYQSTDVPTGSLIDAALDLPHRIELRAKKVEEAQEKSASVPHSETTHVVKGSRSAKVFRYPPTAQKEHSHTEPSNLPSYLRNIDRSDVKASDNSVYVVENSRVSLKGLKSGDVVKAVIEHEIKASPSVPTPIRAIAVSSQYKGAYFLGEATLDRELKRVLLNFGKMRMPENDRVYSLKAAGLAPQGSVGLEGEYHSQTGKFFLAELASATAAGMVDATIQRNQTAYGGYIQEPSLGNSAKQGAVTALARTADRAAEAVRQAPEYTQTQGYQEIRVIIQDDPIESN